MKSATLADRALSSWVFKQHSLEARVNYDTGTAVVSCSACGQYMTISKAGKVAGTIGAKCSEHPVCNTGVNQNPPQNEQVNK